MLGADCLEVLDELDGGRWAMADIGGRAGFYNEHTKLCISLFTLEAFVNIQRVWAKILLS